uniref:Uncharacterized protein n=1 Tax=Plectus sambesii TaxID=2011161 RepID=A0A914XKW7_9BILA
MLCLRFNVVHYVFLTVMIAASVQDNVCFLQSPLFFSVPPVTQPMCSLDANNAIKLSEKAIESPNSPPSAEPRKAIPAVSKSIEQPVSSPEYGLAPFKPKESRRIFQTVRIVFTRARANFRKKRLALGQAFNKLPLRALNLLA